MLLRSYWQLTHLTASVGLKLFSCAFIKWIWFFFVLQNFYHKIHTDRDCIIFFIIELFNTYITVLYEPFFLPDISSLFQTVYKFSGYFFLPETFCLPFFCIFQALFHIFFSESSPDIPFFFRFLKKISDISFFQTYVLMAQFPSTYFLSFGNCENKPSAHSCYMWMALFALEWHITPFTA